VPPLKNQKLYLFLQCGKEIVMEEYGLTWLASKNASIDSESIKTGMESC